MKIYISSTFEDLKDYREKVYKQLRTLRHDVIAMEDYVASDQRPLDKCLQDVESSDIYIGIVAWRYGYIPQKNNLAKISITKFEFLKAVELKKKCLIFLLDKNAPWSPQLMDGQSAEKVSAKNIIKFRKELSEEYTVSMFSNSDQLAIKVLEAIYPVDLANSIQAAPKVETPVMEQTATLAVTPGPEKEALSRPGYPRLWQPGVTLRAAFLDGSLKQQRMVRRFAPIWSAYANINFDFGNSVDAELRVSFKGDGSWYYLATDALNVGKEQPTINFGWLNDNTTDADADYVILRQFGHVLGLINEHLNPSENIPWNKKAVYSFYQGSYQWDRSTINANFFSHWDPKLFPIKKPFDPLSIMAYPIPAKLTDGKFKIEWNTALSNGDKKFVSRLYPFDDNTSSADKKTTKKR